MLSLRYNLMLVLAVGACLSACAGLDTQSASGPCLSDTPECVGQRTAMVKAMSTDPSRAWISQSTDRGLAASGVRLFAYQNVRDKLSCPELTSAVSDLEATKRLLAEGPAAGQTMLRHNDIKAMTDDVRAALSATKMRRCGPGT